MFRFYFLVFESTPNSVYLLCFAYLHSLKWNPISTRRRFDVHITSITLKRRRMDVKTTSCAYWEMDCLKWI